VSSATRSEETHPAQRQADPKAGLHDRDKADLDVGLYDVKPT
jgi:hypothetical protein